MPALLNQAPVQTPDSGRPWVANEVVEDTAPIITVVPTADIQDADGNELKAGETYLMRPSALPYTLSADVQLDIPSMSVVGGVSVDDDNMQVVVLSAGQSLSNTDETRQQFARANAGVDQTVNVDNSTYTTGDVVVFSTSTQGTKTFTLSSNVFLGEGGASLVLEQNDSVTAVKQTGGDWAVTADTRFNRNEAIDFTGTTETITHNGGGNYRNSAGAAAAWTLTPGTIGKFVINNFTDFDMTVDAFGIRDPYAGNGNTGLTTITIPAREVWTFSQESGTAITVISKAKPSDDGTHVVDNQSLSGTVDTDALMTDMAEGQAFHFHVLEGFSATLTHPTNMRAIVDGVVQIVVGNSIDVAERTTGILTKDATGVTAKYATVISGSITTTDTTADASHTQDFAGFGQTWNDMGPLDINMTAGTFDVNVTNPVLPGAEGDLNVGLGSVVATANSGNPTGVIGELRLDGNKASLTGDTGSVSGEVGFSVDNSGDPASLGEAQVHIQSRAVGLGNAEVGQAARIVNAATGEVEFGSDPFFVEKRCYDEPGAAVDIDGLLPYLDEINATQLATLPAGAHMRWTAPSDVVIDTLEVARLGSATTTTISWSTSNGDTGSETVSHGGVANANTPIPLGGVSLNTGDTIDFTLEDVTDGQMQLAVEATQMANGWTALQDYSGFATTSYWSARLIGSDAVVNHEVNVYDADGVESYQELASGVLTPLGSIPAAWVLTDCFDASGTVIRATEAFTTTDQVQVKAGGWHRRFPDGTTSATPTLAEYNEALNGPNRLGLSHYLAISYEAAGGATAIINVNGVAATYTDLLNATDVGNGQVNLASGANSNFNRRARVDSEILKNLGDYIEIRAISVASFSQMILAVTTDPADLAHATSGVYNLRVTAGNNANVENYSFRDKTNTIVASGSETNAVYRITRSLAGIVFSRNGVDLYCTSVDQFTDYSTPAPAVVAGQTGLYRLSTHSDPGAAITGTIVTGHDLTQASEMTLKVVVRDAAADRAWQVVELDVDSLLNIEAASDNDGFAGVFDNDFFNVDIVDAATGELTFTENGRDFEYVKSELWAAATNRNNSVVTAVQNTGTVSSSYTLTFPAATEEDPDGWQQPNNQDFAVPAGLDGRYLVNLSVSTSGANASADLTARILVSPADGGADIVLARDTDPNETAGGRGVSLSGVISLVEGDIVRCTGFSTGTQTITDVRLTITELNAATAPIDANSDLAICNPLHGESGPINIVSGPNNIPLLWAPNALGDYIIEVTGINPGGANDQGHIRIGTTGVGSTDVFNGTAAADRFGDTNPNPRQYTFTVTSLVEHTLTFGLGGGAAFENVTVRTIACPDGLIELPEFVFENTPQEVFVDGVLIKEGKISREMSGRGTTVGGIVAITLPQPMADTTYSINLTAANGNHVEMTYDADTTTGFQAIARDPAGAAVDTSFSWHVSGIKP